MAQTMLGLDLGARAVKAVLLESSYRGFTVLGHATVPLAPAAAGESPWARHAAALAHLLAEQGWKPDGCVATVPGATLASHVITLPFTDPRRIAQTLAFEVEAQIPWELAEAAWDWESLGVRGTATDLWVGVGPKAELSGLLATLAGAGIDPRVVAPPAAVLSALFAPGVLAGEPAEAGAPPACQAILDLGEGRTQVCVTVGAALAAARTVPFGAATVSRSLARDLGISEQEAALLLSAEPDGEPLPDMLAALSVEPRVEEALTRALVPLIRELRSTLRAWRARVGPMPVTRLWLAGGLGRRAGLAERLAAEVDGAVLPLALSGPAASLPAAQAGSLALALAAALRGHIGARAGRVNLRRGDLAFTRDFEHLKGKVVRVAVAAGAILMLAVASQVVKIYTLSRQEQAVDRALCDAEEKVLKKCFPNYEEALSALRGRGVPGAAIPKTSAVDVIDDLSLRMPEGVPLKLEKIDITDRKLHLQGIADAAEHVDRLVASLHGSRCFADARSGGARKRTSDGKFEFSVDSALGCAEGPPGGE
jgi:general secretion pathway protein L